MPSLKISQMPSLTGANVASTDLLPIVDVSDLSQSETGTNKRITVDEFQKSPVSSGVANGVLYLNGSKVATSGSALTFDGASLTNRVAANASFQVGLSVTNSINADFNVRIADNLTDLQVSSATPLSFTLGATEQMRLTSTGLGIGTSSPVAKLEVNSGANAGALRISEANHNESSSTFRYTVASYWARKDNVARTGSDPLAVSGSTAAIVFTDEPGNGGFPTAVRSSSIELWTASNADLNITPTLRMRLDSSGNLGLGVAPSAWDSGTAVQVNYGSLFNKKYGTSNIQTIVGNNVVVGAGPSYNYIDTSPASMLRLGGNGQFEFYTAPSGTAGDVISFTNTMTLDASGNLLVGTTSAQGKVVSNGRLQIGVLGVNNNAFGLAIAPVTAGDSIFNLAAVGNSLVFTQGGNSDQTANTERARIDSSGNLLVGTTNINGVGVSISPNGAATFNRSGTASQDHIQFYNANGVVGAITTSGTTTTYNTSSDYRLKNITGPVTNSGAYIDSLNPVEGTWKADGSTFVGLIAHEVQEVSRTSIATGVKDGEEMQAMDYSNSELIANLIAEVQALRKRVAQLEAR